MTQHTPGPWEVKPEGEILRVWEAQRPVCVGIADVCINRSIEAKGPSEIEHANAHLIAAAPDLLTALKDADACIQEEINLSNYDHQTVCRIAAMWDEAHGIIQTAIASAEGKTND